ncbi:MAG: hypothetical protein CVV64_07930 [Candidatus Wallbacteria bacterium HGW-Wallbacteria-1]|jgi:D-glycero-D-manno-heptose 1,7-bisphosphate phosphatase|uniref:D,D-heptose 1,7-bisphosphate phosphatase n=1 Tax=Candidatus Wallbacteria bacterium HGW-Wallbacteria-1 TaxID=2013854 RepID=A0A2N1PR25_9BACT|nr:MAG: hypothetical protein CVV64_07930 [Candidatus Wallbacteria bacterium HGW-Wallbacteria-1]
MNKAVFLDRDGTINDNSRIVNNPDELVLYSEAVEALRLLGDCGYRLIVVTNQGGVSLGHMNDEMLARINLRMVEQLMARGVFLDGIYASTWHERGDQSRGDDPSWRKPESGMLLRAAHDMGIDLKSSFMVGDRATDLEAGRAAGCRTVLVLTGDGDKVDLSAAAPDVIAGNLLEAAKRILALDSSISQQDR